MLHPEACSVVPWRPARNGAFHRAATAHTTVMIVVVTLTASARAVAGQPSVEQCLQASDASLEFETQGKLLRTRDALRLCASPTCPSEIYSECARRIELVEPKIPALVCEVRDANGQLRSDARVTVDGPVRATLQGGATELEPGTYTLVAEVAGEPVETRSVTLSVGEKDQRVLITLREGPLRSPTGIPARALRRSPEASPPWAPRRVAALVVGSTGIAALGVASVFAVIALNRKQGAESLCPMDTCSSSEGAEHWQSAWRAGNVATAFAVGGGVALTVAAGLWFSVNTQSTTVALGPGQLQMKARF